VSQKLQRTKQNKHSSFLILTGCEKSLLLLNLILQVAASSIPFLITVALVTDDSVNTETESKIVLCSSIVRGTGPVTDACHFSQGNAFHFNNGVLESASRTAGAGNGCKQ
jgi:hypothetical protein